MVDIYEHVSTLQNTGVSYCSFLEIKIFRDCVSPWSDDPKDCDLTIVKNSPNSLKYIEMSA